MKRINKILILSLLVMGLALPVQAKGPGTTSANFLKIAVGARAAALGEAYTALVNDASALYWNPAALANIKNPEFFTAYNSYLLGVSQGYIALSLPDPSLGGSLGIGVNYVDMGKFEGTDKDGNPTGDFGATNSHIFLGYGEKLSEEWSLGISLGSLSDTIQGDTKSAFVGTVGVLKEIGEKYRIGAVVQNLGGNLGEDPLPLTFKIGGAAKFLSSTLSVDVCLPNDNDVYLCLGGEWNPTKEFSLRAGCRTGRDEGSGLSAGAGFKIGKLSLDYAFTPFGDLGNTHKASLKTGL